jgi:hypothetical protein
VQEAEEVGIGISAALVVRGLPLPSGAPNAVNASKAAEKLKERLINRVQRFVDHLNFGEPVRAAEVVWALMNEPGIADTRDVKLIRYPPGFESVDFEADQTTPEPQRFACGENIELQVNQIPRFVDVTTGLWII